MGARDHVPTDDDLAAFDARHGVDPAPAAAPPPAVELPKAPEGWSLTRNLVFEIKNGKPDEPPAYVPVCGPIWIVGRTSGPHGEWGLCSEFIDHDGNRHRFALPAGRLHEDPAVLARELATLGLRIVPGKERRLLEYLDAWTTDRRIPSAKRLGWQDRPDGRLVFVMPQAVISADGESSDIVYQPERHAPTARTVHQAGTLDEWRESIARPAARHPPMLLALAVGLAPPWLAYAEASDSFVVHAWGATSKGKTTLAQIAASPWGCAADPNDAPSLTFVRRWNMTANGLEGLAEAHSDLPLVLDELGASTADVRPMLYALAGGQGKTALTSARELKEPRAWRTIAWSTGELSLHARMSEAGPVKGGLVHRGLDIEIRDIGEQTPAHAREALVEGIKSACARHYGHAGPALVRAMCERFPTAAAARAHVKAEVERVMHDLAPAGLPTETRRALKRFALIAVAGEFAAAVGLIPTDRAAVRQAVRRAADEWLGTNGETDDIRIVAAVRGFIFRHGARFQDVDSSARPVLDRAGWVDHTRGEWMMLPEGLREAAPGHDLVTIARALKGGGFLRTDKDERLTCRVSVDGNRPRLYVIKRALLQEEAQAEVEL